MFLLIYLLPLLPQEPPQYIIAFNCLCKSDASYHKGQKAGLGVHISLNGNQEMWSLHIQAKTSIVAPPL
jgi:hypothetical protein